MITPRTCSPSDLERIGGIGHVVKFRVTGVAYEGTIWAARVSPVSPMETILYENPVPTVVLALTRDGRITDAHRIRNWQPVSAEQQFEFEAKVGEKVILRIEQERLPGSDWHPKGHGKKLHSRDEDTNVDAESAQVAPHHRQQQQAWKERNGGDDRRSGASGNYRGNNPRGRGNRGGGPANRDRRDDRREGGGGYGRGGGRGGGRGQGRGGNNYRSLDDVGGRRNGGHDRNGYTDLDGGHQQGGAYGQRDGGIPYDAY